MAFGSSYWEVGKKNEDSRNQAMLFSYLLVYFVSWSVKTIPGIVSFDLKNLWKEAGGNGTGVGSLITTLYLLPVFLRIPNILLT